jgi:hypothetical protein
MTVTHAKIIEELNGIREMFVKLDVAAMTRVFDRLRTLESGLAKTNNDLSESKNELDEKIEMHVNVDQTVRLDFEAKLAAVSKRLQSCEEQVAIRPELEEHVVKGDELTVDLLVRSTMRNSRRIDHFDEQVCEIRGEHGNVTAVLVNWSFLFAQTSMTDQLYWAINPKNKPTTVLPTMCDEAMDQGTS